VIVLPKPGRTVRDLVRKRLRNKTPEEQLREIKKIYEEYPWTVGDYRELRNYLKGRTEDLSKKIGVKSHYSRYYFKKESPQIAIISIANSGKSTLLKNLTGTSSRTIDAPFATSAPELGSIKMNDIRIQVVELPAFYEGVHEKDRELLSVVKSSDSVLSVVKCQNDMAILLSELEKSKIALFNVGDETVQIVNGYTNIPGIVSYRCKPVEVHLPQVHYDNLDDMKKLIYDSFGIIRVYPKKPSGQVDDPLVFFSKEVTIQDFVERLNVKLVKKFRFAKVWGCSVNYQGEQAGLHKQLSDGDMVRLYF